MVDASGGSALFYHVCDLLHFAKRVLALCTSVKEEVRGTPRLLSRVSYVGDGVCGAFAGHVFCSAFAPRPRPDIATVTKTVGAGWGGGLVASGHAGVVSLPLCFVISGGSETQRKRSSRLKKDTVNKRYTV